MNPNPVNFQTKIEGQELPKVPKLDSPHYQQPTSNWQQKGKFRIIGNYEDFQNAIKANP